MMPGRAGRRRSSRWRPRWSRWPPVAPAASVVVPVAAAVAVASVPVAAAVAAALPAPARPPVVASVVAAAVVAAAVVARVPVPPVPSAVPVVVVRSVAARARSSGVRSSTRWRRPAWAASALPRGNGQTVRLPRGASLTDLAERINAEPAALVTALFHLGEMITATQSVNDETLQLLGAEIGWVIQVVSPEDEDRELLETFDLTFGDEEGDEGDWSSRPPVVTVMASRDQGGTPREILIDEELRSERSDTRLQSVRPDATPAVPKPSNTTVRPSSYKVRCHQSGETPCHNGATWLPRQGLVSVMVATTR